MLVQFYLLCLVLEFEFTKLSQQATKYYFVEPTDDTTALLILFHKCSFLRNSTISIIH